MNGVETPCTANSGKPVTLVQTTAGLALTRSTGPLIVGQDEIVDRDRLRASYHERDRERLHAIRDRLGCHQRTRIARDHLEQIGEQRIELVRTVKPLTVTRTCPPAVILVAEAVMPMRSPEKRRRCSPLSRSCRCRPSR